jgi:transcriptional regulator with XRE-family HTH domain
MDQIMSGEVFRAVLGKKIKILRKLKPINQVELAKELGYKSTGTISLIENGIKGMKVSSILKVAKFFDIHPAVLLSPLEMEEEDLKMFSDLMKLMERRKKEPDKIRPYFEAIRKLLEPT